ncbi:MAG: magnesium chelatase subunit [Candidatus Methanomethylophilaceae archaeon]|nr:magnesium chelatase subunit [Candidatus Methanomethylophilaceae archaeon]MDI3542278.1 magnesium chelatase subunit [Candidatus Methanomethylophilaceae archaeon]HII99919.1 AAA domain-containing protein [Candidatus Methanomethylophilaceae archaeon]
MPRHPIYPFTALVGQNEMKEVLLLNVVNPSIGGVLIRGEKGTAKSTAVRSLGELLPSRDVVKGCPFHCNWDAPDHFCSYCQETIASGGSLERETIPMRVVELPLSATEDRVAGTLDISYAISTGRKRFEPGILAEANGNILYVDEVNLLDDHLVDLLLDAAAMGMNFVEREGVSFSHPAKFILIGTMNPEEGDLRPQLLDRFGLVVDVHGERDPVNRVEVIKRRVQFESDPEGFLNDFQTPQEEMKRRLIDARERMAKARVNSDILEAAVEISLHLGVDGHRADLTLVKAAMAWAALSGRDDATTDDVLKVARMALPHRMRRQPFEESKLDIRELDKWLRERFSR